MHYFIYDMDHYNKHLSDKAYKGVFSLGRAIVSNDKVIGILIMDISQQAFNEAFRYINDLNNKTILYDDERKVLYNYNIESATELSVIDEAKDMSPEENHIVLDSGDYLYIDSYYPNLDWTLVSLSPLKALSIGEAEMTRQMIVYYLVILLVSMALSIVISRSITKKVRLLKETMEEVRGGNLKAKVTIKSDDEIGLLSEYFSKLMDDMNDLLIEVKDRETQKRYYELKSLQSQINPHFMYNTLNTIIYLAEMNGASNIEEITTSLIELLRAVTHDTEQEITISQELGYVKNYVQIQEYKYMGRFTMAYDIEEGIQAYKMPKFILQPFVENSLIHGIGDNINIIIQFSIYSDEDHIYFRIKDNGKGVSEARLKEVWEKNDMDGESIGIMNIRNRLSLYYNNRCDIEISSVEGSYTKVLIVIPKSELEI